MKGFAKVSVHNISIAIKNHLEVLAKTTEIRDRAVNDYYNKYYPTSGWWTRWTHRKSTPQEFFWAKCASWMFNTDYHLYEFLTQYEIDILNIINYGDKDSRKGLEALVNSSQEDTCLLDEEYCKYVNKYNEVSV